MANLIMGIGMLVILLSGMGLISPCMIRNVAAFWEKGARLYLAASVRIFLGAVFFLGAAQCKQPALIYALGAVLIFAGALIFVMGLERVKLQIKKWREASDLKLRLLVLPAFIFGVLILAGA